MKVVILGIDPRDIKIIREFEDQPGNIILPSLGDYMEVTYRDEGKCRLQVLYREYDYIHQIWFIGLCLEMARNHVQVLYRIRRDAEDAIKYYWQVKGGKPR